MLLVVVGKQRMWTLRCLGTDNIPDVTIGYHQRKRMFGIRMNRSLRITRFLPKNNQINPNGAGLTVKRKSEFSCFRIQEAIGFKTLFRSSDT